MQHDAGHDPHAEIREEVRKLRKINGVSLEIVSKQVAALQARGFKSPYLRNYLVARINPVRFHKSKPGAKPPPALPLTPGNN